MMCGGRARGVIGGWAAVRARGKGQGREDACPGRPDDADTDTCVWVVRASCGGASGPSSRLCCLIDEGRGLETGAEARTLNLRRSLCLGHACP